MMKRTWTNHGAALIVAMAAGATAMADEVMVYTSENAPDAPAVDELERRESVSQYGITWTFDEAVPVGRFVTGDYYVVGPVTVASVSPAQTGRGEDFRNGSMLNPPVDGSSAYDGRFTNVTDEHLARVARFPLEMQPGDSLVSSVSLEQRTHNEVLHGPHRDSPARSPLRAMAVLTVLEEPVPSDTFRPGYADLEKDRLYRASEIRWERLLRLELPGSAPDMAEVVRMFERPWVDHVRGWTSRDIHAIENMPGYGREVGRAVQIGALMMLGDFSDEQKAPLVYGMMQVAIDNWAVATRGGGWPAQGGFGNGRKAPIVLAAVLFDDEAMSQIAANAPDAVFGEDQHTELGEAWTGAKVRFTGQYPEAYAGNPEQYADRGPYEHLEPRDWPGNNRTMSESYRRCCTSISWVGQALAVRLLEAERVWDHAAFFAYVDRWMTEDDGPFLDAMQEQINSRPGIRQGTTEFDPFVDDMWAMYRGTIEPAADETWR
ncbi:MAG: hypothetical protein WD009_14975 [Phycisphaeraceae bacterium]